MSHILEGLGRNMLTKSAIIAIWSLLIILTGCVNHLQAELEGGITLPETGEAEESVDCQGEDASGTYDTNTDAGKNTVILLVYGGWDDEADVKNEDNEFTIEDEQAQTITSLFYNHEVQINDSPTASVETLAFQIGEDRLGTSMGGLRTLSGRINGKLVTVELSDREYESVYQIVSQYAQGVP